MLTPRGTSHLNLKVSETKCFCVSRKWSILVAVSLAYSNWRPWAPRLARNTIPALPTYWSSSRSPEHFTKWRGERFLGKHRQKIVAGIHLHPASCWLARSLEIQETTRLKVFQQEVCVLPRKHAYTPDWEVGWAQGGEHNAWRRRVCSYYPE